MSLGQWCEQNSASRQFRVSSGVSEPLVEPLPPERLKEHVDHVRVGRLRNQGIRVKLKGLGRRGLGTGDDTVQPRRKDLEGEGDRSHM